MPVDQSDLNSLNSAVGTVKSELEVIVDGLDVGEELTWTPDADVEARDNPGPYRIRIEEEDPALGAHEPTRAVQNNAQMRANMLGLWNSGVLSSLGAIPVPPFAAQLQSIDFDGVLEKMESVAATLGIANVLTLAGWVKPNSLAVSGTLGGIVPSTSAPNAVGLYQRHAGPTGPNGIQLIITNSGGTIVQNVAWPNVLSGGIKWYHVLVQWAGTVASRKLFVDGVDQGAPSFTATNLSGTLTDTSRIMQFAAPAGGVPAFAGRQAAWQAWDKILGALEITDVYNLGSIDFDLGTDSGNYASSANLQHWLELGKLVSPNLGQDSGVATPIDAEAAAVGITDADRVVDVP